MTIQEIENYYTETQKKRKQLLKIGKPFFNLGFITLLIGVMTKFIPLTITGVVISLIAITLLSTVRAKRIVYERFTKDDLDNYLKNGIENNLGIQTRTDDEKNFITDSNGIFVNDYSKYEVEKYLDISSEFNKTDYKRTAYIIVEREFKEESLFVNTELFTVKKFLGDNELYILNKKNRMSNRIDNLPLIKETEELIYYGTLTDEKILKDLTPLALKSDALKYYDNNLSSAIILKESKPQEFRICKDTETTFKDSIDIELNCINLRKEILEELTSAKESKD